jgi:hypothetical protein
MILCFVQHENSNKIFLFDFDLVASKIKTGDTVICDTRYGEAKGTVKACAIFTDEEARVVAFACKASWPLARIIRKYEKPIVTSIDEVPQEIIDEIRRQEVSKIINQLRPLSNAMPFDL